MERKTVQRISVDADNLYKQIRKAEINQIFNYETLSGIVQKNVQKEGRGLLDTAINKALMDDEIVFATIRNVGIKRLSDQENSLTTGQVAIKRIRSIGHKSLKKLHAVQNFDGMSTEAKIKHNMSVCVLGAFKQATHKKKIDKVESAVREENEKLAISRTLDFFK